MLPPLPPEIFDLIVDHLHDETTTLKECCLVSKSWVPRARRYIFAKVTFVGSWTRFVHLWFKTFPDPFNSPGHHTRILYFHGRDSIFALSIVTSTWVHHFCHVKELVVQNVHWWDGLIPQPFRQLHGLSPTLKSLSLDYISVPLSVVLDLICSFPLLEDLLLQLVTIKGDANERETPSTSPMLTGSLTLAHLTHSVVCELLDLPNGLHFTRITGSDANLVADLIPRCSDTLESLGVYYPSPRALLFSSVVSQHLTAAYRA